MGLRMAALASGVTCYNPEPSKRTCELSHTSNRSVGCLPTSRVLVGAILTLGQAYPEPKST
eukprot:1130949-Alexandrium_andersonii.AAC.1